MISPCNKLFFRQNHTKQHEWRVSMDYCPKPAAYYEQPVLNFTERSLEGSQEYVNFIPDSHLRIWYNTQTEGYDSHYHNAMEIIVCMENRYKIFSNNQTYVLNIGDILIIPPYMIHELLAIDSGARFIFLINTEILSCFQDFNLLDTVLMEPYLCTPSTRPEIYQHIYQSLIQMADLYFTNDSFWEISIYSILLNIMSVIGLNHFYQNSSRENGTCSSKHQEYHKIFTELLSYIDAHYAEDLTLEQMAAYTGFSKYHFTRLFKQHTNTTFYNYLCHKRIQVSQQMLTVSTDSSVTDIAFRVGFNNLTTFCRCFRKYVHCSPTEYRNKFRAEEIL